MAYYRVATFVGSTPLDLDQSINAFFEKEKHIRPISVSLTEYKEALDEPKRIIATVLYFSDK